VARAWALPANDHAIMTQWTREEAVRYLREASGRSDVSDASLMAIAEKLGRLPLALSQAAASLINNSGITAEHYLADITQRMKEMPEGVLSGDPVFATFQLATNQAEAKARGAKAVLAFASFFAPENIPVELFTQSASFYPTALRPLAAKATRLHQAISALERLALIDFDPAGRVFSLDPHVQAAARDTLRIEAFARRSFSIHRLLRGAPIEAEWNLAAVKAFTAACPANDIQHREGFQRFLPHALAVANMVPDDVGLPLAQLLDQTASYFQTQGAGTEALRLLERALAIRGKVLGPNHPDVAQSLNKLAIMYSVQGAYDRALLLHERALATREKVLDPNHPDVAQSLNNLAEVYNDQGAYKRALPLFERALAIREKALGSNHLDVAQSLNSLAQLCSTRGAYDRALPLYERALTIRENALGPNHPVVAQSLNNLAALQLAIFERALGPSHPDTKQARENLTALQSKVG